MTERMSSSPRPSPYNRRTNKPLVEKRRRARINDCLGELKTLVLQAMKQDSAQISRLEKADILEMTVKYLHHVQRQQSSLGSMVNNPHSAAKYRAGFTECASEVMRYMSNVRGLNPEVGSKLTGHLAGCLSMVNSATSPQMGVVSPSVSHGQVPHTSPIKQKVFQHPLQIPAVSDAKVEVVSPSRDYHCGNNVLLPLQTTCEPQQQFTNSVSENVSVARPVPTLYAGLKNITNTYVAPSNKSPDFVKTEQRYSPLQTSPRTPESLKMIPKFMYDPISPVHSPPQFAFHEEKLWRPW